MIIKNVKIMNFDSTIDCANIEIEGKKIAKIIPNFDKPKYIAIPGYIDLHIHGSIGLDAMDSKQAVEKIASYIAFCGTTTFLPTLITGSINDMKAAIKHTITAKSNGAKIAGIHMEGPFISHKRKGAHDPKYLLDPDIKLLREFQKIAQGKIKKLTYAPELKGGIEFTKELIKLNIFPTIGHTNGTYDDAMNAINNGAQTCTHLWNTMSGVQNRNPGFAQAILNDNRVTPEIIGDGFTVDLHTLNLSIKIKGVRNAIMVTDAIRPAGLPDGNSISGGLNIVKKGIKIYLKNTKTIAGSACNMHDIFKTILKIGYSINDAVALTSYNAAKFMKWDNVGYIGKNKIADLLLIDTKTYNIKVVIINGKNIIMNKRKI